MSAATLHLAASLREANYQIVSTFLPSRIYVIVKEHTIAGRSPLSISSPFSQTYHSVLTVHIIPLVCVILPFGSLTHIGSSLKLTSIGSKSSIKDFLPVVMDWRNTTCQFRQHHNGHSPKVPSSKLCGSPLEDVLHFVASYPALLECCEGSPTGSCTRP